MLQELLKIVGAEKGERRKKVMMRKPSAAPLAAHWRPCHRKEHLGHESFLGWQDRDKGQNWLILTESRGQTEMAFKSYKCSSWGRGRGAPRLFVSLLSPHLCLPDSTYTGDSVHAPLARPPTFHLNLLLYKAQPYTLLMMFSKPHLRFHCHENEPCCNSWVIMTSGPLMLRFCASFQFAGCFTG